MPREYYQRYYLEHKEAKLNYIKEYYQKNKDKVNLYRRKYALENSEKEKEWKENWRKRNYNQWLLNGRVQSQKRRSPKLGELTAKLIRKVYEKNIQKYGKLKCEYCKEDIRTGEDTLEHKIPISRGGNHNFENLCIACQRCNFSKQNKLPNEFLEYRQGLNYA